MRLEPAQRHPGRGRPAAVDLYWIPLGAGGHSVRLNGRVYELIAAAHEHRPTRDLYHGALIVELEGERWTIEVAPSPDADLLGRGVVAVGAVGSRVLGRLRVFRYEVRCWRDGFVPDLREAVGAPCRVARGPTVARRVLSAIEGVPVPVWGRDELDAGEMWTSNSVMSWVLATAGASVPSLPAGGRAPGWDAGLVVARRCLVATPLAPAVTASGPAVPLRP